jgi:hypothetical protein
MEYESPMSEATNLRAHESPSLLELVRSGATRERIASHLDALGSTERLAQVLAVTGSLVGKLYDLVGGGEALALTDIVPENETGTVILEGRNSLPAFSRFQKRFQRVDGRIVGYNHQTMSPVTGPGYFVVQPPTPGEARPDELYFDYTTEARVSPIGWPAYKPNDWGLSRLVYMDMKDFCRRVARGVLVGKAYKNGVSQSAYFTLTKPFS